MWRLLLGNVAHSVFVNKINRIQTLCSLTGLAPYVH